MRIKIKHKVLHTLRGRLSLWYISSIAVIFLLFSSTVGVLFWFTLRGQIDHHIHIAVSEAKEIVSQYKGDERNTLIKNLVSAQGMTVVVLSPDGAPVLETNSPDISAITEHQLQRILASSVFDEIAPVHFTQGNIRFAASPIQISAGKGVVAVGYSTKVLTETFYRVLIIIVTAFIFLVLPVAYLGYLVIKRQFAPLEHAAQQIKEITDTSALSKRIQIQGSSEELNVILVAFNSMISRLENIFVGERDFFSDAAHTLKTPLAVLRSQIETLKLDPTKRGELLNIIDKTTGTIQDLIYLTKIKRVNQQYDKVSLSDIVFDLSELAKTLGEEKSLRVHSDIQESIFIKGDKKLLQRALSNIVFNAVSYNKNGGNIDITLQHTGGKTMITVSDSGIGIPKDELGKVSSRFFRGSNATSQGSGLGLAIAKAIIESFDGQILIESYLNKGTTVKVIFG